MTARDTAPIQWWAEQIVWRMTDKTQFQARGERNFSELGLQHNRLSSSPGEPKAILLAKNIERDEQRLGRMVREQVY